MDLGSLILAAMLSLGLIGASAVVNAGDIDFDIQVTEGLSKQGYTPQLVEAMMDDNLRALMDFKSIIRPPQVRSAQQKSIVGALAASLNLNGVTTAFQTQFGLSPVRLAGSLMPAPKDAQQFRFLLAGDSRHTGDFIIDATSGDRPLPVFLNDMAVQVVIHIEPYAAALYQFNQLSHDLSAHTPTANQTDFKTFINGLVVSEAGRVDSNLDRAALNNLLGLMALMTQDLPQAESSLKMSSSLDPLLVPPLINLSIAYVSLHRFPEAIATADQAIRLASGGGQSFLKSSAYEAKALALWGTHDLQAASDNFLYAVRANPVSLWGYFYWAELLESAGDTTDAAVLRARADTNMTAAEIYAEVAFPHVRILTDANFALRPIDLAGVRYISQIYAQK